MQQLAENSYYTLMGENAKTIKIFLSKISTTCRHSSVKNQS